MGNKIQWRKIPKPEAHSLELLIKLQDYPSKKGEGTKKKQVICTNKKY